MSVGISDCQLKRELKAMFSEPEYISITNNSTQSASKQYLPWAKGPRIRLLNKTASLAKQNHLLILQLTVLTGFLKSQVKPVIILNNGLSPKV